MAWLAARAIVICLRQSATRRHCFLACFRRPSRLWLLDSQLILPDFEPRRFLRTLSEYRCTSVGAVPAVFTLILQHRDLIAELDLSALKAIKIGSAPVQGHISGVVDIPNACATLWLPTDIFEFDINPSASGPTRFLDGSIDMPIAYDK